MNERSTIPRFWSRSALLALGSAAAVGAQTFTMLPPPPPQAGHAMAYDAWRSATILFGVGAGPGRTWEFRRDRWVHVPTATAPPPREDHAMAQDSRRGRTVLFGGRDAIALNDTWEYEGSGWRRVWTAIRPPPRSAHTMAYDPVIDAVVLFGGLDDNGLPLGDTWLYDGAHWTSAGPGPGPSPRSGAAMAFDWVHGRCLLFGGADSAALGDTWTFDGGSRTWSRERPIVSPPARSGHALASAPALGCLLFGGDGPPRLDDTWVYEAARQTWTQHAPPPPVPAARARHAIASDPAFGFLLFGGDAPTPCNDSWVFDGRVWSPVDGPLPPVARATTALVHDGVRGRLLLHGGWNFPVVSPRTDTWALDGTDWTRVQTTNAPPGRIWRPIAYDARRQRSVVFGGGLVNSSNRFTMYDDTWEFDHRTGNWSALQVARRPHPSMHFTLAYDARRGVVVLFGGMSVSDGRFKNLGETWEWNGRVWTRRSTANAPSPRMASLVYDAGRGVVVLFGGTFYDPNRDNVFPLGETWEYDGVDWRRVPVLGPEPCDRWGSMTYDPTRGRTLLFGGITFTGGSYETLDDLWQFDGLRWSKISSPEDPPAGGPAAFAFDPDHDRAVMLWRIDTGGQPLGGIWQFEAAPVPAFGRYGAGCAGSNGTPSLDVVPGSLPARGGVLQLRVDGLPTGGGILLLGAGLGIGRLADLPLPLDLASFGAPGCDLWIGLEPALSSLRSFGVGGSERFALAIPDLAVLDGLQIALQALVFDTAAPNGFASLSNAGIATIR
jgi:hypothetical protein